jgi:hypothetical protein
MTAEEMEREAELLRHIARDIKELTRSLTMCSARMAQAREEIAALTRAVDEGGVRVTGICAACARGRHEGHKGALACKLWIGHGYSACACTDLTAPSLVQIRD